MIESGKEIIDADAIVNYLFATYRQAFIFVGLALVDATAKLVSPRYTPPIFNASQLPADIICILYDEIVPFLDEFIGWVISELAKLRPDVVRKVFSGIRYASASINQETPDAALVKPIIYLRFFSRLHNLSQQSIADIFAEGNVFLDCLRAIDEIPLQTLPRVTFHIPLLLKFKNLMKIGTCEPQKGFAAQNQSLVPCRCIIASATPSSP